MKSYHVCVVGTGYVGLVTGACLAELGHCVDSDRAKIAALKAGHLPIHEPGLEEIFTRARKNSRLSFKPHTDDLRFAPSSDIAQQLLERGMKVRATDPVSLDKAKSLPIFQDIVLCRDLYECSKGADAAVLVTKWPQYKSLDWKRLSLKIGERHCVEYKILMILPAQVWRE